MELGTFDVYRDDAHFWRWRLRAPNGETIADSGEGYTERNDAVEAILRVREYAQTADVAYR